MFRLGVGIVWVRYQVARLDRIRRREDGGLARLPDQFCSGAVHPRAIDIERGRVKESDKPSREGFSFLFRFFLLLFSLRGSYNLTVGTSYDQTHPL